MRGFMILGLVAVAAASANARRLTEDEFEEKISHSLTNDAKLKAKRAERLEKVQDEIERHNKDKNSHFKEGLNWMSDLSEEELKKGYHGLLHQKDQPMARGLLRPSPEDRYSSAHSTSFFQANDDWDETKLRATHDARSKKGGMISPVKNQGQCGSCVAFASAAVVETCMYKAAGHNDKSLHVDLSEQYFVDCGFGKGGNGCEGAQMQAYLGLLAKKRDGLGELPYEWTYPYDANTKAPYTCGEEATDVHHAGAYVNDYHFYYGGRDDVFAKKLIHRFGAIVTTMITAQGNFTQYKSGVFDACPDTSAFPDHAVVIVGWGSENGDDYWIVKNSWGENWGNNGYVHVKMGACRIAEEVSVALCVGEGAPDAIPPKPAAPAGQECDISNLYWPGITGSYNLDHDVNGVNYKPTVTCVNSICKRWDGQAGNACEYICGRDPC